MLLDNNTTMSQNLDLNRLKKTVQHYAIEHELLSDMTAIGIPIPLSVKENQFCLVYILYFSTPSTYGGRNNPDISKPYAFITIDAKTNRIINCTKTEIDSSRTPGVNPLLLTYSVDEISQLRELHQEYLEKILLWYWTNKVLAYKEVEIVAKFQQLNEIFTPHSLVDEYQQINRDYFDWLKVNSNS